MSTKAAEYDHDAILSATQRCVDSLYVELVRQKLACADSLSALDVPLDELEARAAAASQTAQAGLKAKLEGASSGKSSSSNSSKLPSDPLNWMTGVTTRSAARSTATHQSEDQQRAKGKDGKDGKAGANPSASSGDSDQNAAGEATGAAVAGAASPLPHSANTAAAKRLFSETLEPAPSSGLASSKAAKSSAKQTLHQSLQRAPSSSVSSLAAVDRSASTQKSDANRCSRVMHIYIVCRRTTTPPEEPGKKIDVNLIRKASDARSWQPLSQQLWRKRQRCPIFLRKNVRTIQDSLDLGSILFLDPEVADSNDFTGVSAQRKGAQSAVSIESAPARALDETSKRKMSGPVKRSQFAQQGMTAFARAPAVPPTVQPEERASPLQAQAQASDETVAESDDRDRSGEFDPCELPASSQIVEDEGDAAGEWREREGSV